ncbi:MAG: methionyl-tRNA formyltransferase, partial [Lachnospira sp.]|nr:methionyl-tRNA formyltransferase [Lachnospira sp.]
EGLLKVNEVQLEGKKRMSADAFMRGCKLEAGKQLQ